MLPQKLEIRNILASHIKAKYLPDTSQKVLSAMQDRLDPVLSDNLKLERLSKDLRQISRVKKAPRELQTALIQYFKNILLEIKYNEVGRKLIFVLNYAKEHECEFLLEPNLQLLTNKSEHIGSDGRYILSFRRLMGQVPQKIRDKFLNGEKDCFAKDNCLDELDLLAFRPDLLTKYYLDVPGVDWLRSYSLYVRQRQQLHVILKTAKENKFEIICDSAYFSLFNYNDKNLSHVSQICREFTDEQQNAVWDFQNLIESLPKPMKKEFLKGKSNCFSSIAILDRLDFSSFPPPGEFSSNPLVSSLNEKKLELLKTIANRLHEANFKDSKGINSSRVNAIIAAGGSPLHTVILTQNDVKRGTELETGLATMNV